MSFTVKQMAIVKCLVGIVETGKKNAPPSTIAVLKDKAGISYGRHQATENSGTLWTLLFEYYVTRENAMFKKEFELDTDDEGKTYKEKLFKRGGSAKKSALTNDKVFKELLIKAGKEDVEMKHAQNNLFHEKFFLPALSFSMAYGVQFPLGLAMIYDMHIQSGVPYAQQLIKKFDADVFVQPDHLADIQDLSDAQLEELNKSWIQQLIDYRYDWLKEPPINDPAHKKAVQRSRYRAASYQKLCADGEWNLETPLDFTMKYSVLDGHRDAEFTITEEDIVDM